MVVQKMSRNFQYFTVTLEYDDIFVKASKVTNERITGPQNQKIPPTPIINFQVFAKYLHYLPPFGNEKKNI